MRKSRRLIQWVRLSGGFQPRSCKSSEERVELRTEGKPIEDSMDELLEKELKALDTTPGHAAVAAGNA